MAVAVIATPSCALPLRFKQRKTIFRLQLPTSKKAILVSAGVREIQTTFGRLAVSGDGSMSELVAATGDAFDGDTEGGDLIGEEDAVVGDLGVGSALNQLSKWIVAVLFGIVIVWKHDAEILWAALGSVINTWLSVTLKKLLNHQRPVPHLKSDPGMPSSHAQSIFYGALFLILSLVRWRGISMVTATVATITLAGSSYLSWLRISQQFHTVNQVLVGAALGSSSAILWFWLWQAIVSRAFVSSVLVRVAVVVSSVVACSVFVVHVIRHWLRDDR